MFLWWGKWVTGSPPAARVADLPPFTHPRSHCWIIHTGAKWMDLCILLINSREDTYSLGTKLYKFVILQGITTHIIYWNVLSQHSLLWFRPNRTQIIKILFSNVDQTRILLFAQLLLFKSIFNFYFSYATVCLLGLYIVNTQELKATQLLLLQ